jgi:integrase
MTNFNSNTARANIININESINNNIIQFPIQNTITNTTINTNKTKSKTPTNHTSHNGTVQPIKSKEDIERAKLYFHDTPSRYNSLNLRNYCMFIMGINVARRIGDLLKLRIQDIMKPNGQFKEWISITESKTKKNADFQIHPYVREGIREYLSSLSTYSMTDYLFKSNKGINQPISRVQAFRIMDDMSKALELDINIGTHSLRKTWAYQTIQANKDDPYIIAAVSNELNHNDIKTTYRYSGFDRELRSHLYMDNAL